MKERKVSLVTVLCLVLLTVAVTFPVTLALSTNLYNTRIKDLYNRQSMYAEIEEVDRLVRYNTIMKTTDEKLLIGMIEGYLAGTGDTQARYYSQQENALRLTEAQGTGIGLGLFAIGDNAGYYRVYEVLTGSGAEAAGVLVGDTVSTVDGRDVKGLSAAEFSKLVSGTEGQAVSLGLYRNGEPIVVSAVCQTYTRPSVTYEVRNRYYGYIRISSLNGNAATQFERAAENLNASGVEGFIIDLRHTAGGSYEQAAAIVDSIVGAGDVMSVTDGEGRTEILYSSLANEFDKPVVRLVDEKTSGPAELIAAAIRDYKKGELVGAKTAGVGGFLEYFTLSDGSVVRLTTAIVNAPKSGTFDGVGVKVGYEVKQTDSSDFAFYTHTAENDAQYKKAQEIADAQIDWSQVTVPVVSEPAILP